MRSGAVEGLKAKDNQARPAQGLTIDRGEVQRVRPASRTEINTCMVASNTKEKRWRRWGLGSQKEANGRRMSSMKCCDCPDDPEGTPARR